MKQEPVSRSESSSSSDSDGSNAENSTNKIQRTAHLKITPKNEPMSRSSSSSTSSDDSSEAKHKEKSSEILKSINNVKRKRPSESSIIGESLLKMKKLRNNDPESSDSSSSNNGFRTKVVDMSTSDLSFASPGLSSTKVSTKTTKNKTKCKDSGTNDFLKKMMSRFDK